MGELSWNALKQFVHERASGCCKYCQTCEGNIGQTMQVDHIDPQGGDILENLCLSCWNCNSSRHKVTMVTDPETGARVPLFNPRMHLWVEHFAWIDGGTRVYGLSLIGRATISDSLLVGYLDLIMQFFRQLCLALKRRRYEGGFAEPGCFIYFYPLCTARCWIVIEYAALSTRSAGMVCKEKGAITSRCVRQFAQLIALRLLKTAWSPR